MGPEAVADTSLTLLSGRVTDRLCAGEEELMSDSQGISRQRCGHCLSENGTVREHPVPKFGGLLRLSRICPRASEDSGQGLLLPVICSVGNARRKTAGRAESLPGASPTFECISQRLGRAPGHGLPWGPFPTQRLALFYLPTHGPGRGSPKVA